jgi:hypothetical protein
MESVSGIFSFASPSAEDGEDSSTRTFGRRVAIEFNEATSQMDKRAGCRDFASNDSLCLDIVSLESYKTHLGIPG